VCVCVFVQRVKFLKRDEKDKISESYLCQFVDCSISSHIATCLNDVIELVRRLPMKLLRYLTFTMNVRVTLYVPIILLTFHVPGDTT